MDSKARNVIDSVGCMELRAVGYPNMSGFYLTLAYMESAHVKTIFQTVASAGIASLRSPGSSRDDAIVRAMMGDQSLRNAAVSVCIFFTFLLL